MRLRLDDLRKIDNSFFRALQIVSKKDRATLICTAGAQVFLAFLDLLGVFCIGVLSALSVQGLESKTPGNKVSLALRYFHLSHFSLQAQVGVLGVVAAVSLLLKTFLSIFLARKTLFFLSHKSADISAELISKILSKDLIYIESKNSQEFLYSVTVGIGSIVVGILATSVSIISDFSMLVILTVGLFFVDPYIAGVSILVFILTGIILNRFMRTRAIRFGRKSNELTVKSNQKILEVLAAYRESVVRHRRHFYASEIKKLRFQLADNSAELDFMPYTNKYVIEVVGLLGIFFLAAFEFSTTTAVHAVATIAVFVAANSRIAPAALRIQQGVTTMKSNSGMAEGAFDLIGELADVVTFKAPVQVSSFFDHSKFDPQIVLKDVLFQYPTRPDFEMNIPELVIEHGEKVAIVGSSGAGKTTLVDLLLGVLTPNSGTILISGVQPNKASSTWSGGISYVPQNVSVILGTLRENISLGYPFDLATDDRVNRALKLARLDHVVSKLKDGIDTFLGEGGSLLSGGQRQRLGIARALFTQPKLIVLDEATSSLDGKTESEISEAISALPEDVTVVIVAHRLSTVMAVDRLIYVENGNILKIGTFNELRKSVPEFNEQATLMGL